MWKINSPMAVLAIYMDIVPIELWSQPPPLTIVVGTLSILESRMGSQREQTLNIRPFPSLLLLRVGKWIWLNAPTQHFPHTERPSSCNYDALQTCQTSPCNTYTSVYGDQGVAVLRFPSKRELHRVREGFSQSPDESIVLQCAMEFCDGDNHVSREQIQVI